MGPIDIPKTSVTISQSTLRKVSEERRPHTCYYSLLSVMLDTVGIFPNIATNFKVTHLKIRK
jgi:hypothetical protein